MLTPSESRKRVRVYSVLRYLVVFVACALIVHFAFAQGRAALGVKQTDGFSEQQAIDDARNIYAGKHRFGIVEYCHFPNGPSYMLLGPLSLGFDSPGVFRLVPLGFSTVCIGVLFLGLALYASSMIMLPFALMGIMCLVGQPGVLYWMGGLHEQSYALAICFAAMGVSLMPGRRHLSLAILGFLAGWIGYDMLPGFVMSVFTCRLLVHTRSATFVGQALRKVASETALAALGVLLAVVTHLIQNALFFGSMSAAFKDLIGSAAARAGVESVATINNPYWEGLKFHLQDPTVGSMTRKDLVRALLNAFLSAEWTDATSACVYLTILGGVLGTALLGATFLRKWSVGDLVRIGYVAMLALAGTVLAGIGWILVMPNHARFHFHFLPRHFFVPGVLMWIILCATLDIILTRLVKKKPGV